MVKTYDPKKVLVSLGSHAASGFTDGTFVTIEPNGDGVTKKVGCDGEIVRSLDPDNSYKVKITMLMRSPTVAYCQAMYDRDKVSGDGLFPVLIKDLTGGLVFSADQAWVVNSPSREFAKEASDREIEIDCGAATVGGES